MFRVAKRENSEKILDENVADSDTESVLKGLDKPFQIML